MKVFFLSLGVILWYALDSVLLLLGPTVCVLFLCVKHVVDRNILKAPYTDDYVIKRIGEAIRADENGDTNKADKIFNNLNNNF